MIDESGDNDESSRGNPETINSSVPTAAEHIQSAEARQGISERRLPDTWLVPLGLLVLCLLAYGLLIPGLGFYWDEWMQVWAWHSRGAEGLVRLCLIDRPLEGYVLAALTRILGDSPLPWHILSLVGRWLSAVALWWTLRLVWPKRSCEVAATAMLFAVYPGFTQQPMARLYGPAFLQMLLLFLSWALSLWALRKPRLALPLAAGGSIAFALSLVNSEYFVGLELLRPVLLWLVLSETVRSRAQRFRRVFVAWAPYLTLWAAFVCWRLFIFRSARAATDQVAMLEHLKANPLHWTADRLVSAFTDVYLSTIAAWRHIVPDFAGISVKLLLAVLFMLAVCVLVGVWYAKRFSSDVNQSSRVNSERNEWCRQALVVGALAMVLGGLPTWLVERHIILDDLWDRYTLPLMAGACLVAATVLFYVVRDRKQQVLVLSLILGLSASFHFQNANKFRGYWSDQKSTCWQLWWRAPQLAGGSCLIARIPKGAFDDYCLGLQINMIYSPEPKDSMLDYWVLEVTRLTRQDTAISHARIRLPGGAAGRDFHFSGSRTRGVAAFVSETGCLWLLDSLRENLPDLPTLTRFVVPTSHPESAVSNETGGRVVPPLGIFGPEPKHDWLFYFQKAELGRQLGDWQRVVRLGDSAKAISLRPEDPVEWLPFIEGYLMVSRYETAESLVASVLHEEPEARRVLVDLLSAVSQRAALPESTSVRATALRKRVDFATAQ